MIIPFPRNNPYGLALDWWLQLGYHYGVPIWVCSIDLRFAFGPSPVGTVIWNFELERFDPIISSPTSSSLNLGHRDDLLECELIPLVLIISICSPSMASSSWIVELTVHYSDIIAINWRSGTGGSKGSPNYADPIMKFLKLLGEFGFGGSHALSDV